MSDVHPEHVEKVVDIGRVRDYLQSYYSEHHSLPTIEVMAERFDVSSYKMNEIFRILVHEGFLRRNFSRYKMIVPPTPQSLPETSLAGDVHGVQLSSAVLVVVRVVMALIAVVAVGLSVYYTSVWLKEFLPLFLAVLLSGVMVTFSTMAFEIVIVLGRARQRVLASVFVLLWVVVLVFSMISTVAGQYNQRIKNEAATTVAKTETEYKKTIYETYLAEEKNLQGQVEDKMTQRTTLQKLIGQFDTLEKQKENRTQFNDLSYRITLLDNDVKKLNDQLSSVRSKERELISVQVQVGAGGGGVTEETAVKSQSFYVWIGALFRVEPMFIEFWLSIFPAVFIDLIAPFSLSFSLFMTSKKAGRKNA